jgi:hypothetical protein
MSEFKFRPVTIAPIPPEFKRNVSNLTANTSSSRTSSPFTDFEDNSYRTASPNPIRSNTISEKDSIRLAKIKYEEQQRAREREKWEKMMIEDEERIKYEEQQRAREREKWEKMMIEDEEKSKRETEEMGKFLKEYGWNPKGKRAYYAAVDDASERIKRDNRDTHIDWEKIARDNKLEKKLSGGKYKKSKKQRKLRKSRKHRKSRRHRKYKY